MAAFPALNGSLRGTCTPGAHCRYRLEIPESCDVASMRRPCDEFNVGRLRPYHRRPDGLGSALGPPPPVWGAVGRPEYEVQELLKFKMCWGRPYVLVLR